MKRKKFLSCLLAMAVAAGTFAPMPVKAQTIEGTQYNTQVVQVAPSLETQTSEYVGVNEISSIVIEGLDEPQEGQLLDFSAVVKTDNGAAWKIPVIWVDEDGNIVKVWSSKNKSYPVFSIYIPTGYSIKGNADVAQTVVLPEFVRKMFDGKQVVTIVDYSTSLTFVTCIDGPGKNKGAMYTSIFADAIRKMGEAEKAGRQTTNEATGDAIVSATAGVTVMAGGTAPTNTVVTDIKGAGEDISGAEDDNLDSEQEGNIDDEELSYDEKLVAMHCDENAIETFDVETLAALVELIRYEIAPKAVNILIESFPCYAEAANNKELSSQIGLYIFNNDAILNDDLYEPKKFEYEDYKDALAYVSAYGKSNGDMFQVMGVNIGDKQVKDNLVFNEETQRSELNDEGKNTLLNALIHEMMHAFMNDYTRTGMLGLQEGVLSDGQEGYTDKNYLQLMYPVWFKEGLATSVQNFFDFRAEEIYLDLFGDEDDDGVFDSEELKENYASTAMMQLSYGEKHEENIVSSYINGTLACFYLGALAAENEDYRNAYNIQGVVKEEYEDDTYIINSEVIRQGLNAILSELHGYEGEDGYWYSKSLDEVMSDLFAGSDSSDYSVAEFENDFIVNIEGSAEFCADLLTYLQCSSIENGELVNGSVLLPFDSIDSFLDVEVSSEPMSYEIVDSEDYDVPNFVKSDAVNAYLDRGRGIVDQSKDEADDEAIDDVSEDGTDDEAIDDASEDGTDDEAIDDTSEEGTHDEAIDDVSDDDANVTDDSDVAEDGTMDGSDILAEADGE